MLREDEVPSHLTTAVDTRRSSQWLSKLALKDVSTIHSCLPPAPLVQPMIAVTLPAIILNQVTSVEFLSVNSEVRTHTFVSTRSRSIICFYDTEIF